MNAVEDRSHREKSAALLYRLERWFFAVCIVGGTAATLVPMIANPGYYRPHTDVTSFIAAFASGDTLMSQTLMIPMIVVAYPHCLISLLPMPSVQTLLAAKDGGHLEHLQASLFSPS
jgi:hypothetical protein